MMGDDSLHLVDIYRIISRGCVGWCFFERWADAGETWRLSSESDDCSHEKVFVVEAFIF